MNVSTHIHSLDSLITVNQNFNYIPQINNDPNKITGQVRFIDNRFEIYDGNTWHKVSGPTSIGAGPELKDVVLWAKAKMQKEKEIEELAKIHPAVADIKSQIDVLTNQLEMTAMLCKEEKCTMPE